MKRRAAFAVIVATALAASGCSTSRDATWIGKNVDATTDSSRGNGAAR